MSCNSHRVLIQVIIKQNEIGGACSTYGEEERSIQVLVGKHEGKNHLEDLGADRRII